MYHGMAHSGSKATKRLIAARYYWPHLSKTVTSWCRSCISCGVGKITRHTITLPEKIPVPTRRFVHIHIDIVGPLTEVNGCSWLLTMIDRFTRWPEAVPIRNIEASTVADALVTQWISRFGAPEVITTDRGTQFESRLFASLCSVLGTSRIRTAAYNPRANGMIERFHRQLKDALRCHEASKDWVDDLPLVLLLFRCTIKDSIKATPAELTYGTSLALPADLVTTVSDGTPISAEFVCRFKERMANVRSAVSHSANRVEQYVPRELLTCKYVFLRTDSHRKPLQRPYTGPFEVLARRRHTYVIRTLRGPENVSVHRLKPARIDTSVT